MVSIVYAGRFGNNLLQYCAALVFAKKFNLKLNSNLSDNYFNLPSSDGESIQTPIIEINDENFIQYLKKEKNVGNFVFNGYFQIKEFILDYCNEIKNFFKLTYENFPNKVFVSYRIGDIGGLRQMLPLEYYDETLSKLNIDGGYITTDTPTHPNINYLSKKYGLTLYQNTPSETINFGKNFDNIVLSEGSFSWWIGFLSQTDNVYYNKRPRFWHGDIFVLPQWNFLQYDWCPSCVGQNNFLKCNKIIKI
jgi:hypothetical protein